MRLVDFDRDRIGALSDGGFAIAMTLVDRDVASVGSANFDNRSFRLQFEINAIIVDEAFGRQVEAMLLDDMAHSVEWDPSTLKDAPLLHRLAVSVARLTAPVL